MKSKKSSFTFNGSGLDFLHNKYVLYISFFFAILTAARYLFNFNLEAIVIFVVLGFLTTYFSKNMIVVLLTTTIGTNFIMMFKNKRTPTYYNIMEGLTARATPPTAGATPPTAGATPPATGATPPPSAGGGVASATSDPPASEVAKQISQAVSAMGGGTAPSAAMGGAPVTSTNTISMPGAPAPANNETGNKQQIGFKTKERMTQLNPASYDGSSGDATLSSMFQGMASGAAGQRNQAYNTLNSLGGGGGANTGDLMAQQTEMINNLKSIEPILKTAEKFLDKFDNSAISKVFQSFGGNIPGMSLLTGGGGNGGGNGLNPASIGA
jgi:hypothetical protein